MRILFVNDDGIRAPGLRALVRAFQGHTRFVVAPSSERSAHSHAITIRKTIPFALYDYDEAGVIAYSVEGTPADCTKIGMLRFPPFDLVLSGINVGSNVGIDTRYSGTVAAAMEAVLYQTPAMAVSLDWHFHSMPPCTPEDFECAAALAREITEKFPPEAWPEGTLLNLNAPAVRTKPELRVCGLGPRHIEERMHEVPEGLRLWYQVLATEAADTDCALLERGYATLTPLSWDATAYAALRPIGDIFQQNA